MKYLVFILFQLLLVMENPVFCQKNPQETIILEATVRVLQNAKRGGIGNISEPFHYTRRGSLKEVISELKGVPRSQTIEQGYLKDHLFRDSNSLVEIRMQTVFNQRVANLMLDQLQFRFNFSLDSVKIDTMAWVISSPKKLADTVSRELDRNDYGYYEIGEYCGFMEELIVFDSSVDGTIQLSAESYERDVVFDYLRKRYGFDIVRKKCTLNFLVIHYHNDYDAKKYNRYNLFLRQ
jgi:hypothetical protein